MKIEVLLFAQLREAYGRDRLLVDLPTGSKVVDALDIVFKEPALMAFRALPLRYAINEEFGAAQNVLTDNDQLAILTPVAGG